MPPATRCSSGARASARRRWSRSSGSPTSVSTTRSRSPTRSGCAGAAPRSRSRASSRSRPAAARRTATSARSRVASTSPVRAVWLDIPSLVEAARQTAATGATEFCIVAAVRGPDERLMAQVREGVAAIRDGRRHQRRRARSGMLTREQVRRARRHGRAPLQPQPRDRAVATSRTSSPRTPGRSAGRRCGWCATPAWRSAAAASSAWARRSSSAPSSPPSSPRSSPHEVPLNFLNPRPGTPFADLEPLGAQGRAAHDRRVPARAAAHDPALRRRPRAHARRPRRPPRACSAGSTRSSSATT